MTEGKQIIDKPRQAVLMMILSALIISTSGLVMRNLENVGDWQIVFWRGISLAFGIFVVLVFKHRANTINEFKSIGKLGFLGGIFLGGALIGYILAIANTTVANAVFTMGAVPFVTAILAWITLGERVSVPTWIAILLAIFGFTVMVSDGISTGSIFGNIMALFAVLCASCYVVVLRKGRSANMLPTLVVGALISASIAGVMMADAFDIMMNDLLLCLMLGGVIACSGQMLFVMASRHLKGAELSLLTLIEFILAPLWVWVFVNEIPSTATFVGGSIVFIAAGGHALISMYKHPA